MLFACNASCTGFFLKISGHNYYYIILVAIPAQLLLKTLPLMQVTELPVTNSIGELLFNGIFSN